MPTACPLFEGVHHHCYKCINCLTWENSAQLRGKSGKFWRRHHHHVGCFQCCITGCHISNRAQCFPGSCWRCSRISGLSEDWPSSHGRCLCQGRCQPWCTCSLCQRSRPHMWSWWQGHSFQHSNGNLGETGPGQMLYRQRKKKNVYLCSRNGDASYSLNLFIACAISPTLNHQTFFGNFFSAPWQDAKEPQYYDNQSNGLWGSPIFKPRNSLSRCSLVFSWKLRIIASWRSVPFIP